MWRRNFLPAKKCIVIDSDAWLSLSLCDLGNDMENQPQDVAGKNEIQVGLEDKPKVENIPGNGP